MAMIHTIYAALQRRGLLTQVWHGTQQVWVNMRQPDEMIMGDMAIGAATIIEYPTDLLPDLASGDRIDVVSGPNYRVRGTPLRMGDGTESRAALTAL